MERPGVTPARVPASADWPTWVSVGQAVGVSSDASWTPQRLFAPYPGSLPLYRAVKALVDALGECTVSATKSQVAFRRRRGFAYAWRPGQYVRSDVPLVLSVALPQRSASDRFKEVVQLAPGLWMHHLELRDPAQLDDEVRGWLGQAFAAAG